MEAEDLVAMELEMLESVFPPEDGTVAVREGGDAVTVVAKLRPYTAEEESKQFVRLELSLTVARGCSYPDEPPSIALGRSSGLDDAQRDALRDALCARAACLAEGGEAMLLALLEQARELLTSYNTAGECPICMGGLAEACDDEEEVVVVEGEGEKPDGGGGASSAASLAPPVAQVQVQVLKTPCFHRFHVSCFARFWRCEWRRQQELAASAVPGLLSRLGTAVYGATAGAFPAGAARVGCPQCRERVPWESVAAELGPHLCTHAPNVVVRGGGGGGCAGGHHV